MNALLFGLSLASAAAAQVANGVSAIPYSAVYGSAAPTVSAAASSGYQAAYQQPAATYAPSSAVTAAPSAYTPPPASSSAYDVYSAMPYSSFMSGGYKSMNCGYGYQKAADGSCQAMSWWNTQGCYETIIINHECVPRFCDAETTVLMSGRAGFAAAAAATAEAAVAGTAAA